MNREIEMPSGAGLYPLIGDAVSTPGSNRVVVTGLDGIPIAPGFPSGGSSFQYIANTNSWTPILEAVIQVNGITMGDDPYISVNVLKAVLVNGS